LVKQLFAFSGNLIAARFAYEFHDGRGTWLCAYGSSTHDGLTRAHLKTTDRFDPTRQGVHFQRKNPTTSAKPAKPFRPHLSSLHETLL
jgi:hypothetical protein